MIRSSASFTNVRRRPARPREPACASTGCRKARALRWPREVVVRAECRCHVHDAAAVVAETNSSPTTISWSPSPNGNPVERPLVAKPTSSAPVTCADLVPAVRVVLAQHRGRPRLRPGSAMAPSPARLRELHVRESGCTASAVFETSVHGVVVQTRIRGRSRCRAGPRAVTSARRTRSGPRRLVSLRHLVDDSAVPQRAQYGRILCPRYSSPRSYSVFSAHQTLST
jgi:hypothetical protein